MRVIQILTNSKTLSVTCCKHRQRGKLYISAELYCTQVKKVNTSTREHYLEIRQNPKFVDTKELIKEKECNFAMKLFQQYSKQSAKSGIVKCWPFVPPCSFPNGLSRTENGLIQREQYKFKAHYLHGSFFSTVFEHDSFRHSALNRKSASSARPKGQSNCNFKSYSTFPLLCRTHKKMTLIQPSFRHHSTSQDTIGDINQTMTSRQPLFQHYNIDGKAATNINQSIHKKMIHLQYSFRHYSTNRDTVEKKLISLMDMWEVEKAVELVRESVEGGVLPNPTVILDLQQQLANLGEVECLLDMHDFLKEHNLITDDKFFHCLKEAYYFSGRISEGVAVLRLLYHRTRKFADVEVYFTLLTVMVLHHFPDHIDLLLGFVQDLKDAEVAVLEPEASLWKCYMMLEMRTEADDLLLSSEGLQSLLPAQVARVCHDVDKVDFNKVAVLSQMLDLPFIRRKLRVLVAETLVNELYTQKQWIRLRRTLRHMKNKDIPLHVNKLWPVLDALKLYTTPQFDKEVGDLIRWCTALHAEEESKINKKEEE